MAAVKRTTVVGVFADHAHADKAVAELRAAGFRDDQIGVAMKHIEGMSGEETTDEGSHAGSGAMTGILTGLGLGALAGLGVLSGVIPVIGPAIAAGTLGIVLSNAAAGAGIAGLVGALIGAGVPEHEAKYYQDEFEAGRVIVTVQAGTKADEATTILRRNGGYDMISPATSSTTTTSRTATTTPMAATTTKAKGTSTAHAGDTIEVKEERLHATKTPVETGEVRVRKEVHTETKTINVPVEREEVVIERTPVHGKTATTTFKEGEEIRIPVSEEKVKVSKEAVVTEEVKVGKRVVKGTEQVSGQVRKEEVRVEEEGDVDVENRTTKKSR